jgi:hypothetical protein
VDPFRRLMWFLVGVLLAVLMMLPGISKAATTGDTGVVVYACYGSHCVDGAGAAATLAATYWSTLGCGSGSTQYGPTTPNSSGVFTFGCSWAGYTPYYSATGQYGWRCTGGAGQAYTAYPTLPSGASSCSPPDCSSHTGVAIGGSSGAYFDIGTQPTGSPMTSACHDGCLAIFAGTSPAGSAMVGGSRHYYAHGSYSYAAGAGFACSAGDDPTGTTGLPSDTCGAGQYPGTVNGVFTCVGATTGLPSDGNPVNATQPSWCHTGTSSNADGSTDTTTWSGVLGECLVAHKTPGAANPDDGVPVDANGHPLPPPCYSSDGCSSGAGGGGSGGGTSDSTSGSPTEGDDTKKGLDKFCAENPDTLMCREQTFSGACTTGFTCDGDPVFCSIAEAQNNAACQLIASTTTMSDLGTAAAGGSDPLKSTFPDPAHPTVVTMPAIDATEPYAASCLPDTTVALYGGQSFTLSTAKFCEVSGWLGTIFVMLCGLVGVMIVGRGGAGS